MSNRTDPPSAAEDCASSRSEAAAAGSNVRENKPFIMGRLNLGYSFDLMFAAISVAAVLAVLQSFVIGRHYIIPSVILVAAVVLGNIAWYGLQGQRWAKMVLFWSGFLFTCHAFFALFWSKAYRDVLGSAFEWVCVATVILFVYLLVQYVRQNKLFG